MFDEMTGETDAVRPPYARVAEWIERAGLDLDRLPFTGEIVEALALNADGGIHRGRLHNISPKRGEGFFDILAGDVDRPAFEDLRLGIVRRGRLAQPDDRAIGLIQSLQEAGEAGCGAEQQHQPAGGHGV